MTFDTNYKSIASAKVNLGGESLDISIPLTLSPIPGSEDVMKIVLGNALRKYIGISTSELAKVDISEILTGAVNSIKKPYAPHTDYPVLDKLYMGVLLSRVSDKQCECEGSGFNRYVQGVEPCNCVNKTMLLDYYEKWYGSLNFQGDLRWQWERDNFLKHSPDAESPAEYYIRATHGQAG